MLPDKVYARYYVEDCGTCSDGEINRAAQDEILTECGECNCNMCEECMQNKRCVVCDESQDYSDEPDEPAMCDSCKEHCNRCNHFMHRKCKAKHLKNCNETTRAKRDLAAANDTILCKKYELERANSRVSSLEEEIRSAKKLKNEAKATLQKLELRKRQIRGQQHGRPR